MSRNEKETHIRGWIFKNTRIDRILNIKFAIMMNYTVSNFKFHTYFKKIPFPGSIVNGVDKYVTESMPTAKEEDIPSAKPMAKARVRKKPQVTLTSVSILVRDRKWIDIETQRSRVWLQFQWAP